MCTLNDFGLLTTLRSLLELPHTLLVRNVSVSLFFFLMIDIVWFLMFGNLSVEEILISLWKVGKCSRRKEINFRQSLIDLDRLEQKINLKYSGSRCWSNIKHEVDDREERNNTQKNTLSQRKNYNYTCKHGTVWQQCDGHRTDTEYCFKKENEFERIFIFSQQKKRKAWCIALKNHRLWFFKDHHIDILYSFGNCLS